VRLIWEKLVLPNPNFCEFRERRSWALAKKKTSSDRRDFSYMRVSTLAARRERLTTRIARKLLGSGK
jgi:hypothetical protein